MNIKAHPYLSEIESYKPGKSKVGDKNNIIKLSSNENAFGTSSKAALAYQNNINEVFRYADGSCGGLRAALAKKHNIDAEKIVCGACSDEISLPAQERRRLQNVDHFGGRFDLVFSMHIS